MEQKPVYRVVMTEALKTAWQEWRYWPLALFASILFSSGSYDVLLRSVDSMAKMSTMLIAAAPKTQSLFGWMTASGDTIDLVLNVQVLLAITIVTLLVLIGSCVGQGALIYAIGARRMGRKPTITEAIRVGGSTFWPVAMLNALALSGIWALRVVMSFLLKLALETQGADMWFLYFIAFLGFAAVTFGIAVVQIFTLNGMILQGASLHEAIVRGWKLLKEHWIVAVEIALVLIFAAGLSATAFVLIAFIASLPYFAAIAVAIATNSLIFLIVVRILGTLLFFGGILTLAAFLTQLQYTAWMLLFRRLGEGGVLPKVKRLFRSATGDTSINKS